MFWQLVFPPQDSPRYQTIASSESWWNTRLSCTRSPASLYASHMWYVYISLVMLLWRLFTRSVDDTLNFLRYSPLLHTSYLATQPSISGQLVSVYFRLCHEGSCFLSATMILMRSRRLRNFLAQRS